MKAFQGGPLPVINEVRSPMSRLIHPVKKSIRVTTPFKTGRGTSCGMCGVSWSPFPWSISFCFGMGESLSSPEMTINNLDDGVINGIREFPKKPRIPHTNFVQHPLLSEKNNMGVSKNRGFTPPPNHEF